MAVAGLDRAHGETRGWVSALPVRSSLAKGAHLNWVTQGCASTMQRHISQGICMQTCIADSCSVLLAAGQAQSLQTCSRLSMQIQSWEA